MSDPRESYDLIVTRNFHMTSQEARNFMAQSKEFLGAVVEDNELSFVVESMHNSIKAAYEASVMPTAAAPLHTTPVERTWPKVVAEAIPEDELYG